MDLRGFVDVVVVVVVLLDCLMDVVKVVVVGLLVIIGEVVLVDDVDDDGIGDVVFPDDDHGGDNDVDVDVVIFPEVVVLNVVVDGVLVVDALDLTL